MMNREDTGQIVQNCRPLPSPYLCPSSVSILDAIRSKRPGNVEPIGDDSARPR